MAFRHNQFQACLEETFNFKKRLKFQSCFLVAFLLINLHVKQSFCKCTRCTEPECTALEAAAWRLKAHGISQVTLDSLQDVFGRVLIFYTHLCLMRKN